MKYTHVCSSQFYNAHSHDRKDETLMKACTEQCKVKGWQKVGGKHSDRLESMDEVVAFLKTVLYSRLLEIVQTKKT